MSFKEKLLHVVTSYVKVVFFLQSKVYAIMYRVKIDYIYIYDMPFYYIGYILQNI